MRNSIRIFVVTAMALGVVGLAALPGGAGAVLRVNTVTVVKIVDGPVAPTTTFTVGVDCANVLAGSVGTTAVSHTDITFDSTGQPTSNDRVSVGAGIECTATETVNGGATSTTYACDMVHGSTDQIGPPFLGNCTADNVATFTDVLGDAATITVTNTFPTPETPPAPPVVQAIQAAPNFTG
jgi:hypothetical protein